MVSDLIQILQGDVREVLPTLADESVHCVVTSPPYWGLRDYGIPPSVWDGDSACKHRFEFGAPTSETNYVDKRRWQHTRNGRDEEQPIEKRVGWKRETVEHGQFCRCGAWRGALGLEATPELYIQHAVQVFRDMRRVLRSDGTLWLNMGDSYASGDRSTYRSGVSENKGQDIQNDMPRPKTPPGLKAKDLCGIPWMLAFALRADGWYLRQDIIWSKPNPMPESVTDRCTKAHEYIFLLSKSEKYFYDADAIKEAVAPSSLERWNQDIDSQIGSDRVPGKTNGTMKAAGGPRSARDSFKRNGSKREQAIPNQSMGTHRPNRAESEWDTAVRNKRSVWTVATQPFPEAHFATFPEELIKPCILAGCPAGGTVLDPFFGSGTTGLVARAQGCNCIGIELSADYIEIARKRLRQNVLDFSGTNHAQSPCVGQRTPNGFTTENKG